MRVLGIDPGLTRCGFGVVDVAANRTATLVAVKVIGTVAHTPLPERLLVIAEAVDAWLELWKPDVLAVERVFSQTNLSTVMGVAQASGIVIAAAARHGVAVALHTPSEVKAAVTGDGRADKAAVTAMVTRILRLSAPPTPADAADALALAIASAWRSGPAMAKPSTAQAMRTGAVGLPVRKGTAPAAQKIWLEAEAKARKNREKPKGSWG
ncbi:crossover junction endodeoxyribonuclease RuvC [Psychromicrobium xiongbiense]|uniref:crossover junction endodeoxyribonuclease RuvC n=1 Tax=Psychromicrobium xiongbiense TaxID=3051184 RepID=UPI0025527D3C|nr:crossover junction endodeoxyribonuclease RuvC [Psychromicrobium sp. YIM S02556]